VADAGPRDAHARICRAESKRRSRYRAVRSVNELDCREDRDACRFLDSCQMRFVGRYSSIAIQYHSLRAFDINLLFFFFFYSIYLSVSLEHQAGSTRRFLNLVLLEQVCYFIVVVLDGFYGVDTFIALPLVSQEDRYIMVLSLRCPSTSKNVGQPVRVLLSANRVCHEFDSSAFSSVGV